MTRVYVSPSTVSLKGLFESHTTMREQGLAFVETIKQLLQLLLEYRAGAQDDIRENRMSCTVGLLVCILN